MPFSPETIALKPYNQCIKCDYLGVKCDGPNVIAMSKMRFCEWCRDRKDFLGWSNSKLAEVSCVSKTTIDRIMTGKIAGLNGETISAVTCALVYGYAAPEETWGKYPCPMGAETTGSDEACADCKRFLDALRQSEKEAEQLREKMEQQSKSDREKIDFLKQQVSFKEDQMLAKDKQLVERADFLRQKNRTIRILSVLLCISVSLIIAALFVDVINPNIGFFWIEQMAALTGVG